jgi:hypothetical protein
LCIFTFAANFYPRVILRGCIANFQRLVYNSRRVFASDYLNSQLVAQVLHNLSLAVRPFDKRRYARLHHNFYRHFPFTGVQVREVLRPTLKCDGVFQPRTRQVAQEAERMHQIRLARSVRPHNDVQRTQLYRGVLEAAEVPQA